MGKFDAHKNFALSSVATAPSPATTGTSLIVTGGDGTKFPAVPFNAVIWPTGAKPTSANSEIVRVTNIATDTFTIIRQQEGTSARTVIIGDQIMDANTAKVVQDLEGLWGFRSVSATDLDEVLPESNNLVYDDMLEVGSTVSLELPATSTLEIAAHIDQSDPEIRGKILTDIFMGNNFASLSPTTKNFTLDENKDFMSIEMLEIGAGFSLEVPTTSSLEIRSFLDSVSRVPMSNLTEVVAFKMYRAAATTSNNSFQVVNFDTIEYDYGNNCDIVTNVGRAKFSIPGIYWFAGSVGNTAATSTQMGTALYKNGVQQLIGGFGDPTAAVGSGNKYHVSGPLVIAAGDYVEIFFIGGAGSVVEVGLANCWFAGIMIGKLPVAA